jgi:hypothetical protein
LAPHIVVAGRRLEERRPAARRQIDPQRHEAFFVGERQRFEPYGAHETEDRGSRADAEREHGNGDDRETRRAQERAGGVPQIAG